MGLHLYGEQLSMSTLHAAYLHVQLHHWAKKLSLVCFFFLPNRIVDIVTVSPVGLLKSNLNASTTPQQWFVDVTWTPSSSQSGPNIFCYYALDSIG